MWLGSAPLLTGRPPSVVAVLLRAMMESARLVRCYSHTQEIRGRWRDTIGPFFADSVYLLRFNPAGPRVQTDTPDRS